MTETDTLPHSTEAERTILGAVLVDNASLIPAREMLRESDFYAEQHRRLWSAYCAIADDDKLIDTVSLLSELRARSQLEAVGGMAYISTLLDGLPKITNIGGWAAVVLDKSRRREAMLHGERLRMAALDPSVDLAETLDSHQSSMMRLLEARGSSVDVSMQEALRLAIIRMEKYQESHGVTGIPSGIERLDYLTSGWQGGQLIIVAARPACGKSSLCSQFATFAAAADFSVRVFPLEMSPTAVAQRMLMSRADVSKYELRQEKAWEKIGKRCGELAALPITFDRRGSLTATEIVATCRRHRAQAPLRMVIVDYLQRVSYPQSEERIGVGAVAKALKSMAMDLDIPVIAACQLSRAAEGERPTLGMLAKSGDIEAEADIVLALHPCGEGDGNLFPTELLILKQREGETTTIKLSYEKRLTRFHEEIQAEEWSPSHSRLGAVTEVPS